MGLGSNMAGFCSVVAWFLKNAANIEPVFIFYDWFPILIFLSCIFLSFSRKATRAETLLLNVQNQCYCPQSLGKKTKSTSTNNNLCWVWIFPAFGQQYLPLFAFKAAPSFELSDTWTAAGPPVGPSRGDLCGGALCRHGPWPLWLPGTLKAAFSSIQVLGLSAWPCLLMDN